MRGPFLWRCLSLREQKLLGELKSSALLAPQRGGPCFVTFRVPFPTLGTFWVWTLLVCPHLLCFHLHKIFCQSISTRNSSLCSGDLGNGGFGGGCPFLLDVSFLRIPLLGPYETGAEGKPKSMSELYPNMPREPLELPGVLFGHGSCRELGFRLPSSVRPKPQLTSWLKLLYSIFW